MKVKQFEIWIADLNPTIGTEPGKTLPVLVIQTNLLNRIPHPSTLICPITVNVNPGAEILRVNLMKGTANLEEDSDVMLDQVRAIDNRRLVRRIGEVPAIIADKIKDNLRIIFDFE